MKNVKKILYVLMMTMSFLSFVACSDDSGGGTAAITPIDACGGYCPQGFNHSLDTSAIGKDYSFDGAERAQVMLRFFGASGQTLGGGQIAANGYIYLNQNFYCAGGLTIPVRSQLPLQTVQLGTMTGTDWIQGLVLKSGTLELHLPSIRISSVPLGQNLLDLNGNSHTRAIQTLLQADVYVSGQYCNRMSLGLL